MNIYLIEQSTNTDYETFDSAVVVAESMEAAKQVDPDSGETIQIVAEGDCAGYKGHWCDPKHVLVTYIGTTERTKQEVICASFNAG